MSLKDISDWCFSFVTLFNLQGTRRRLSQERNVFYLTTFSLACQALFSTFFGSFFSALPAFRPALLRQLAYSTRTRAVCQALFSLPLKFFQLLASLSSPLADGLTNITDPPRFVNSFPEKISKIFPVYLETFFPSHDIVCPEAFHYIYCGGIPCKSRSWPPPSAVWSVRSCLSGPD